MSPGRRPAAAPGAASSLGVHSRSAGASAGITQALTEARVVLGPGSPMPTYTIAMSTNAMRRFMTGPPSMTTSFFGVDKR